MENDLFMSMLPTWHSPEILPPELNYSSASTGKLLPLADCFFKFNSAASSICSSSTVSPSRPAFHPPTNDNSLIKELIRNSTTGNFCSDPRFSGFRSQSFNGRTTRFHPNRSEFPNGVHQMWPKRKNFEREDRAEFSSSWEESSVSDPDKILGGEKGLILRKRKVAEVEDDLNPKRVKQIESNNEAEYETTVRGFNGGNALVEEETAKTAAPEPPKDDYIHVRARRGQATDSHSIAERVRREKIGERMRILQNLVPGCNKVTGKALMLDEIINYVQSLQRQVQFLSMKLATVNSVGSNSIFNMEVPKMNDVSTNRTAFLDSSASASAFSGRNPKLFSPLALDGFSHPILPVNENIKFQYENMFGDDLHNIINTGFGACMKIEL